MDYVFMIIVDSITNDVPEYEINLFKQFDDALTKFQKLIEIEKDPYSSWVGEFALNENEEPNKGYTLEYSFSDNENAHQYWCVAEEGFFLSNHYSISLQKIRVQ